MSKVVNNITSSHMRLNDNTMCFSVNTPVTWHHMTLQKTSWENTSCHQLNLPWHRQPMTTLISQTCHNMSSVELPITDSNGVTNPKFIILTTCLTTGLTAHVRRCVWCKPCKLRRKFTDIWPNLPFTRLAHWILTDCEPSHTTLGQQIRWRMMAKTKGGRQHCCTYSAARGHSVTGQTSREAPATHVTTRKAS